MLILLSSDETIEVVEADNFRALSVQSSLTPETEAIVLHGQSLGRPVPGDVTHLWLSVSVLHDRAASAAGGPEWEARWVQMIAFAASRGWLSTDGAEIRAHIERR